MTYRLFFIYFAREKCSQQDNMTDQEFCFKQFKINQTDCAMKVGTDSVLLGAWANLPQQGNILDIGSGTGILSLMAAQRSQQAHITGIEIDNAAATRARMNVAASAWSERIDVINSDFAAWAAHTPLQFESILSNPPYFEQSLLSPDATRTVARHTIALSFETIFDLSRRLILPQGTLSLVIPTQMFQHVNSIAALYGWGNTRHTQVHTTARKPAKRSLCEWRRNHYAPCQEEKLYIHDANGNHTREYTVLTQPFYIHF